MMVVLNEIRERQRRSSAQACLLARKMDSDDLLENGSSPSRDRTMHYRHNQNDFTNAGGKRLMKEDVVRVQVTLFAPKVNQSSRTTTAAEE